MGDLHKVKEDQNTFMKFYKMKKSLLPSQINTYVYQSDSNVKWRPSAREWSVISYVSTSAGIHKFYVYSGLSNIALNDVIELYIKDEDSTTKWIKNNNIKVDSDTDFGRYGATQITFEEKTDSQQECLNQIIKYVPSKGEFKSIKQSGIVHPARRYHSSWSFGKYMFTVFDVV